jgi:hypothetical protein
MRFVRTLAVSLCLLAAVPARLAAQEMTPAEMPVVQAALNRGTLLHAYDKAAWHGTDAMLADAAKRGLTDSLAQMIGGWIVVGATGDPKVIFFDKSASDPRAVFIIQTADAGRRVVSTRFVEEGEYGAIDKDTQSLIRARLVVTSSLPAADLTRCAKGPWNMVVLPPEGPGAPILVYLLSPQDTLDAVHFGGHYRIEVSADGTAAPAHAFTKTCIAFPTSQAKEKPAALVVTQLLDPLPTEISVFTMFAAELPMYVRTPDMRTWVVGSSKGQAYIRILPDEPKAASSAR